MRLVIQRVTEASVEISGKTTAQIGAGLLVLVGIEEADSQTDIDWLANKLVNMRLFADEGEKMNLSLLEIEGEVLIVSQFTLFASTKKGNRPGFTRSAKPAISKPLYENFVNKVSSLLNKPVATGEFGADMQISLINDGPVTITIDSHEKE